MVLLYAEKKFGDHKIYLIDMLEERENPANNYTYARNTFGISPELKFGDFNFHAGFYLQHGADNISKIYIDSNGKNYVFMHEKISAHMYTVKAFYSKDKIEAGASYESWSGEKYNDNGTDGINHIFTVSPQIYGAHKLLGSMDYFSGPQIDKTKGVTDLNIFARYGKKTSITASAHMLSYAQEKSYNDGTNNIYYKTVGTEIDLVFNQKIGKEAFLKIGYSVMLPGAEHLKYIDLGYEAAGIYGQDATVEQKTAQWAWVMFSFKPQFLKFEK